MSLTPKQRDTLWGLIVDVRDKHPRSADDAPTDDILDAIAPVINQWLFEAHIEDRFTDGDEMHALGYQRGREAGAAEVRARVEAVCTEWESWALTRSTPRIDTFRDAAERIRAALTTEDPS